MPVGVGFPIRGHVAFILSLQASYQKKTYSKSILTASIVFVARDVRLNSPSKPDHVNTVKQNSWCWL